MCSDERYLVGAWFVPLSVGARVVLLRFDYGRVREMRVRYGEPVRPWRFPNYDTPASQLVKRMFQYSSPSRAGGHCSRHVTRKSTTPNSLAVHAWTW